MCLCVYVRSCVLRRLSECPRARQSTPGIVESRMDIIVFPISRMKYDRRYVETEEVGTSIGSITESIRYIRPSRRTQCCVLDAGLPSSFSFWQIFPGGNSHFPPVLISRKSITLFFDGTAHGRFLYLSVCSSFYMFVWLSGCLFVFLPLCMFVWLSFCLFVCSSVCQSTSCFSPEVRPGIFELIFGLFHSDPLQVQPTRFARQSAGLFAMFNSGQ